MPSRARPPLEPKVLVVEDEALTRISYAAALRGAGYRTFEARDGVEALEIAGREQPDLVLLDVDMPRLNGWKTLERLRQDERQPAIIMLTGQTQVDQRVRGLSDGADDYLCKPCDHRELLARVHAVLRRNESKSAARKVLHFGPLTVDLTNHAAAGANGAVDLTRIEYAMLELFARHPGELVTRERMLEAVWGYTKSAHTRTVDTHIWRLRQKLGDHPGEPRWIQTVQAGGGYRMICDPVKD